MIRWCLIFLGGGLGSLLRYAIGGWIQRLLSVSFPWGTLVVNLLGCAAIGFLASLLTGPVLVREEYRLAVIVGLLGGFTTFSSYCWETISLTDGAQWAYAAGNILASNVLGLAFAWIAARLALKIYGA
jgi:fluoride exporter